MDSCQWKVLCWVKTIQTVGFLNLKKASDCFLTAVSFIHVQFSASVWCTAAWAANRISKPPWRVLGFSITECTLESPGLRTLELCIVAAVRGPHLSINGRCKDANDGWRLRQLNRGAGLQPRQMKSSSLCVLPIFLAVPARNGSLKTKTNKLDIWIWTLNFNHSVAAALQVVGGLCTHTRWKLTHTQ